MPATPAMNPRRRARPTEALGDKLLGLLMTLWLGLASAPAWAAPPIDPGSADSGDEGNSNDSGADADSGDDADSGADADSGDGSSTLAPGPGRPSAEPPESPESATPPKSPSRSGLPPSRPGPSRPRAPAQTGDDAPILPGSDCDLRNRGDPLYPALQALGALRAGQLELVECHQAVEPGHGSRLIEARVSGRDHALLMYRLERLASDGFEVFIAPTGTNEVLLGIRPAVLGGAVAYIDVDVVSIRGSFVEGDSRARLETIIGLRTGIFYPFDYAARLAELGYRAEFLPVAKGEVVIQVRPGRSIRRVRVRGYLPLAKRDIMRQLSVEAQPGALARGQCIEPKRLRQGDLPPICESRDVACLEWERDELARVDTFLFDSGYLQGTTSMTLVCGRDGDEADLYVFLKKHKPFKVDRWRVDVIDSRTEEPLDDSDARWIRRQFIPRVLGVFRTRITREFVDSAVEKVERGYAEPNASLGQFWRTQGDLPYPEVKVETSYESLSPEQRFTSQHLPIEVRVDLGPAVQTEFKPAQRRARKRRRGSGLSFSDSQLRGQIQLFNRREPATAAAARRESANLRAHYQNQGYLFAVVDGQHLDFTTIDKLRFVIEEGPKVKIADLELVRPARLIPAVAKRIEARWFDDRALHRRGTFSESEALRDIQALTAAYNSEGYLCASVTIEVAFWKSGLDSEVGSGLKAVLDVAALLESGGRPLWLEAFDPDGLAGVLAAERAEVWVRMHVEPGPRVLTSATEEVRYLDQRIPLSRKVEGLYLRDPSAQQVSWGAPRMLRGGPLRHDDNDERAGGMPVTPTLDRDSRTAIVRRYRDSGFPVADAELTWRYTARNGEQVIIDSTRAIPEARYGICSERARDSAVPIDPVINVYEGRRGNFGDTLFRGNFKTRTWVLRRELAFEQGDPYSQHLVDESAAAIESMGVARSVSITPYPLGCYWDEDGPCEVHQVVAFEEAKDLSMTLAYGFGAATLNPFYVFANPSFPNMFGTGWDLRLEGRWGFDASEVLSNTELCAGQECYERLAAATLSRPHIFASAFDLDINGRIQERATPARGKILTIVGSLRLSRRFREWTFYGGYLIQLANISKDLAKPLAGSNEGWLNRTGGIVPDLTGLLETGAVLTRVDNPFNPYDGFMATADIKLASPWLGGRDWWARIDLSWRQFIPIPRTQDRLNFRYSLRYGHLFPFHGPGFQGEQVNTDSVPAVWRYYGGGTADLGLRGILAETMLVDVERIELPQGGTLLRPRAQGGHIRAIGSIAIQVTSIKSIVGGALAHSLFYDFGVLTQRWSKFNFARDFRHSVGVNFLKLDINIVTMALGYAVLLPGRYNVGPTDDANGRFVFDVGVTF